MQLLLHFDLNFTWTQSVIISNIEEYFLPYNQLPCYKNIPKIHLLQYLGILMTG